MHLDFFSCGKFCKKIVQKRANYSPHTTAETTDITDAEIGTNKARTCCYPKYFYFPFLPLTWWRHHTSRFSSRYTKSVIFWFIRLLHVVRELQSCKASDSETHVVMSLWSSSSSQLVIRRTRLSTVGDCAFPVAGCRLWNSLPPVVTSASTLSVFQTCLKTHLFSRSFPS